MITKLDQPEMRDLSEQEIDTVNGGALKLIIALALIALLVANDGK